MIIGFLLFFLISCFLVFCYCKEKESLFNHFSIFSLGFSLYLVVPMILGESNLLSDSSLFSTFNYLYNRITDTNKMLYFTFIVLIYFGYIYGIMINRHFSKCKICNQQKLINKDIIIPFKISLNLQRKIGYIFILFSLIFVYKFFPYFFKGYLNGYVNRGSFAAFILIYCSYMIMLDLRIYKESRNLKKSLLNIFNVWFIVLNVLLLSLGTRMYFIASLFTIFVLIDVFHRFDKKKIFIGIFFLFIIVGVVGVLRSGYTWNFQNNILINSMEFLYTFISSLKFMELGIFKFINIPIFLFNNFINLIPTFIFPSKLSYIINPSDFGYVIYTPEGALSVYVDLMMNFGMFGSVIVMMGLGFLLEFLNNHKKHILSLTIYVMMCGFMGFSFFRDGFVTSLIKNIFEFSIVFPILYYIIFSYRRKKHEYKKDTSN